MNTDVARSEPITVVYIIDDDGPTRRALVRLMQSAGFGGLGYASTDEFLDSDFERRNACIVADVHMQGMSTLALPHRLQTIGANIPVIYLTADYSHTTRDSIREAGGSGYFKKPVDDQALIDLIRWTLDKN